MTAFPFVFGAFVETLNFFIVLKLPNILFVNEMDVSKSAVISGNVSTDISEDITGINDEQVAGAADTGTSIICLDEDEEYQLPELPFDLSSAKQTNEPIAKDDDDFSIVYEKIIPPPEVQILITYPALKRKNGRKNHVQSKNQTIPNESNSLESETTDSRNEDGRISHSYDINSLDDSITIIDDSCVETSSVAISVTPNDKKYSNVQRTIIDSTEKKKRKIECGVCFDGPDEISVNGRNLVSTVCGHIFCDECLKTAIKNAKKCPQCRKRLNAKQYHPIYI